MQAEQVKQQILKLFPDADVTIDSDGYHYQATIVSDIFQGQSPVQRQQLVYKALGSAIASGALHALSMQTFTPEEWQAKNG